MIYVQEDRCPVKSRSMSTVELWKVYFKRVLMEEAPQMFVCYRCLKILKYTETEMLNGSMVKQTYKYI